MAVTVTDMCEALERNQLLSSADLAALRTGWSKADRKEASDPAKFIRWLLANRYATEFVVEALVQGKADQLVLNQYRVRDRLKTGPMTGALLATDPAGQKVAIEVLAPDTDEAAMLGIWQVVMKAIKVKHVNVAGTLEINNVHDLHYLVKEYCEGDTIASVLARRGKLPHLLATRLFALAFAGLEALHNAGIPGGDLTPDCLLLAETDQGANAKRTVKILHAGVRRRVFENTSLVGRVASEIPEDVKLQTTFGATPPEKVRPEKDLFKLGCAFYLALTGVQPYAAEDLPEPSRRATPVREREPEVPSMLADIVEELIDPDPSKRPKKAAHVAKALRVYLAAEKDGQIQPEEYVPSTLKDAEAQKEEEEDEVYQLVEEAKPKASKRAGKKDKETAETSLFPMGERDLAFLSAGGMVFILVLLAINFVAGWDMINAVCLLTGAAATFLVERLRALRNSS